MTAATYEDFKKLDFRVGTVTAAERVEGADKLLKLIVDIGSEERTLAAGIAQMFDAESLVGKRVIVAVNLEPRTIRGIESSGMILAACPEGDFSRLELLTVGEGADNGWKVY